ncbi:MAG TPA: beta-N-acetylglucosaminidase domain-containing protein, partial [Chitinophagaceae bacterium]|nr:beta-N-acetylglucosaminidase domain-containing protein [Chitinophagaceae bacterium]
MKNRYYLVLIALLCFFNINLTMAQDEVIYIYPQVQELTQNGDAFSFNGFQLKNYGEWSALVNRTTVEKMLASSDQNGLPLKLEIKDDIELWQNSNNLAEAEGAYILSVNKNQVSIAAEDSVGIFYGLQTLRQLVKDGKIYPVEIKDFPTVKYRGVVEGFYGTPWSQEDRMSQIKFYGRVKANTYIYGPKDDPYHSSPNWRKPYPPKQAANIKKLVKAANANFVDFVWAIHPGQDIKWNEEDRENVLKKFESMYDLGVRSFAVFFDDISGIGTDAHKQAALLNYLTDNFVKVKKGVKPLILTPTDYNKSWANPDLEDGYLAILGKELDPSVQIMWTGDQVMSDVTESTLAWVKKRIQRPALVWWNFPVSDYERNQLFIGPSYGLEKNINGNEMAGILSNPMEHAEASKPAIYGVADYGWNTATYNPEKSWEHSLKILLPHSYKAYKLFGENNSNPSSGITSYIGKESEDIAPYLTRIKEGIKKGDVNREDMIFTEGYFLNIRDAGSKIIAANDDPMLLEEVTPWLNSFTALGQEGINQLENYKYHAAKAKDYWHRMLSDIENSNYWHPDFYIAGDGTKTTPITGSRVLRPFIDFLQNWNSQTLFTKIVGEENVAKKALAIGQIHTNIAQ